MVNEQNKPRRGKPQKVVGTVVTSNRSKTIKVVTDSLVRHPVYGKYMRHRTVCHAHDERGEARTGDRVELMECRPYSKTKRWRLVQVVEKSRTGSPAAAPAGAEG